ncbi:cytochrome P450 [Nocardia camponoti]|uniref:Cytochrome P450 140 n=1 Tax=Nocardia camponoti TaxID=1616106 RepID=A0A917QFI5_9NOCA|nr:cytochrome P450 [Nocardia camponoti]GGK46528.1 putative cytochrome P450 140 [Nocardia camponoti]
MKPSYVVRWLIERGLPRFVLAWHARKRDPFAELINGEAGLADPYPIIEALRGDGGLVRTPLTYTTFSHRNVRAILRDNRFGVQPPMPQDVPKPLRVLHDRIAVPVNPAERPSMLVVDPPLHTKLRRPVASAFTPRAIERLRERVEVVTEELLDAMPAEGSIELVSTFATRLPMIIISDMLGFPHADRERFLAWGDRVTPLLDIAVPLRIYLSAMAASEDLNAYLADHIAKLREEPGEDILSSLVVAGELDMHELQASASLLMGAGFETTVNLIGNAVVALSANPDQRDLAIAEPDRWADVVEETLRFDPPVQTTARRVLTDLEIDGTHLAADKTVVLSLAGANRDPLVFDDPHRFDITRPNAKDHVSFSSGIHACLGATLARMEAEHALRALYGRYPNLRLASEPKRRQLFTLRGYEHVPVELGPARRTAPAV